VLAAIIANWVVTIFRGLPFLVRYMTFAIGFSILELGPTLGLGIIPNMALILLVLVTSVALFFGTAKAMWAVGVFFVVHMAIAWGWVNGSMPIFINRKEDLSAYMDMTSPRVWFRVMITASGLIMTVLYMMRFMLHDTRRALHGAEQALQRLAVEQLEAIYVHQKSGFAFCPLDFGRLERQLPRHSRIALHPGLSTAPSR